MSIFTTDNNNTNQMFLHTEVQVYMNLLKLGYSARCSIGEPKNNINELMNYVENDRE